MSTETIAIEVSSEITSKLFLAYVGLSDVRKSAVNDAMKASKISRNQATFNEITTPRIEMYAERGAEAQKEVMSQALNVLQSRGMSEFDAKKALGLGE